MQAVFVKASGTLSMREISNNRVNENSRSYAWAGTGGEGGGGGLGGL